MILSLRSERRDTGVSRRRAPKRYARSNYTSLRYGTLGNRLTSSKSPAVIPAGDVGKCRTDADQGIRPLNPNSPIGTKRHLQVPTLPARLIAGSERPS